MIKRILFKIPPLVWMAVFFRKIQIGCTYLGKPFLNFITWLFKSKETTNFTYFLDDLNRTYFINFLSEITGKDFHTIEKYFHEIENNQAIKNHVRKATQQSEFSYKSDKEIRFGRRLGWYVVIRVLKPKIVIETGIDKGLGSCIITSALMENEKEGFSGYYYGTDINPNAGFLFQEPYARYGKVLYGDSIESLKMLNEKQIDLFINDSDHSAEYEAKEYQLIKNQLAEQSVIIGDNSELTSKLLDFAQETGRKFMYFQEKPKDHWYHGSGFGIAYKKDSFSK